MSKADHVYYMRRADEEATLAERAETREAKAVHQQLKDLYLVRAGAPRGGSDSVLNIDARG